MIKLSILMPAKNAAPFIDACIESIVAQGFSNWQLIVVDDGSVDDTATCVKKWAASDQRITLLKNEKRGIIPALQMAFEKSSGTYVTRMDADDLMPPGKLLALLTSVREKKMTVVTGYVQYFSDTVVSDGYQRYEHWLNQCARENNFFSSIYRECIVASPNWMVHRSCFENHFSFSDLNYPEDYDMVFRWYKAGYCIEGVNTVTHLWREHPARTSRHDEAYQQESFFKLKTNYFVDLQMESGETVQLFGAGIKGKLVAQILIERKIPFEWFDFTATSHQRIFDRTILALDYLKKTEKAILTAWPIEERTQQEIKNFLSERGFEFGKNLWLF